MPTFDSLNNNQNYNDNNVQFDFTEKQTKTNLLSSVFKIMFIALFFTAVLAFGIGYGFNWVLSNSNAETQSTIFSTFVFLLIVSGIGILVLGFVLPMTLARGKHSILPGFITYCTFMGILLSMVSIFYDPFIIGVTFGVTSLIFALMAILGYTSKGSMSSFSMIISGLFGGILILSIINLFLTIFGIYGEAYLIDWIISFAIFALIMFVTIFDVKRIKDIASTGSKYNNNLVYYCSFILYTDFINLFLRLLYYISILFARKK